MTTPSVLKNIAAQAVTAGTPVTIWTPATGKQYRILGYAVSLSVAGSVIFKNNHASTPTEIVRTPVLLAGTGIGDTFGAGILPGAPNDLLQIDVSASGTVSGYVYGEED